MNQQFQAKWSGLDTFIVLLAWLILSTGTMFRVAGRLFEPLFSSSVMADYIGAVAIHVALLVIVGAFILLKYEISLKNFGFRSLTKQHIKSLCLWIVIGLVLNTIVLSFTALIWSGESSKSDTMESTGFFLSLLMVALIAPLVEEVIFRGVVYKFLRFRFGMLTSIVINGFLFGIDHAPSWELVLNAAVMGAFFAYIYERSNSLWVPIIVHGFTNASVTTLFFLLM